MSARGFRTQIGLRTETADATRHNREIPIQPEARQLAGQASGHGGEHELAAPLAKLIAQCDERRGSCVVQLADQAHVDHDALPHTERDAHIG